MPCTTTTTTTTDLATTTVPAARRHQKLIIAGAGPCGLLLALLLARSLPSLQILVLESWSGLDTRLRATQYGVPATRVFKRAGLLPDIREASIESFPSICWRRTRDHEVLTGIDLSVIKDHEDRMTILPLNLLVEIMYRHCMDESKTGGRVEVKFEHEVVAIGQKGEEVWVDVRVGARKEEDGGGGVEEEERPREERKTKRFEADYLVGCDGSKSAVRHCLFGREWPGETFDCHLLVQNVWYDGFEKHNWDGGNYMIDPDYWGLIAKRGKGGLWRVTYGDIDGLSNDEYEKRRETAFEHLLPGRPKPGDYKITQTDHFRTHNRCVESMRVGRILLAGDAAHVNNPWGGYGCMAAVLDAGALAECLIGVYQGKAGDEILDLYSDVRREKYLKYIDERSRRNFNRVRNKNPDQVMENDKLLKIFEEIKGDPEATRAFLLKKSSIEYDFTQHYH